MKKYYLNNGSENIGPLTFEELKQENISNETLLWYEGMPEWKKANEFEELKELLKVIPPPIHSFSQVPPLPPGERSSMTEEDEPATILGIDKKVFVGIVFIILISIFGFYKYHSNESRRIQENYSRIIKIQNLLTTDYKALEKAKRHLNDVTGFKLLRTSSERNQQINEAQNNIDAIKIEIAELEEEMKNLSNNK